MPLILRMSRNKNRWCEDKPSWLKNHEIHADPLADFVTTKNSLSVWRIEDNKSNLQRVIAALAAIRDSIDKFDYVLFDEKLLKECDIKVELTEGNSPDQEANAWHYDLLELSAQKLVKLAEAVWEDKPEADRVMPKKVRNWVVEAKESRWLDPNKIRLRNL